MVQQLHATALGTFNTCPYKYKNDKWDIDASKTFPGDILNVAMVSRWGTQPFLDYFTKYFEGDFKLCQMLKKIYESARSYVDMLIEQHPLNYQETKFYYRVNPDLILVGTPDFFFYDKDEEIWTIIDWKTSANFNWYKGNDIWNESFQPYIYALFIMEYFKVDKVKFKFEVFSKTNGEQMWFERPEELGWSIFYKEDVYKAVHDKVTEFEECQLIDVRPSKSCRFCNFCNCRKTDCPLYNKVIEEKSEEL